MIDDTGRYRYSLSRQWQHCAMCDGGSVLWIMLNPSTADATVDDPTIRRCMGFSRAWGFDGLTVVNLFAWRATDPKALRLPPNFYQSEHLAVIGGENDATILRESAAARLIVAAWGNHGSLYSRDAEVRELLYPRELHHLGLTKMNQPRHPLYVRATQKPVEWRVGPHAETPQQEKKS